MALEFPLMLYKPGTMLEWDGELFDYVIVNDQEEADVALADGWSVEKPKADPLDHDGDGKKGGSRPRKPKAEAE